MLLSAKLLFKEFKVTLVKANRQQVRDLEVTEALIRWVFLNRSENNETSSSGARPNPHRCPSHSSSRGKENRYCFYISLLLVWPSDLIKGIKLD